MSFPGREPIPVRVVAAGAVVANPLAGRYVEDLAGIRVQVEIVYDDRQLGGDDVLELPHSRSHQIVDHHDRLLTIDPEAVLVLAANLNLFWWSQGKMREGRVWLERGR